MFWGIQLVMKNQNRWWAFAVILLTGTALNAAIAADKPDFDREVRPLLADRCFSCHGPDENTREADLRLDDFANFTKQRDGYAVVVPGQPDRSLLMERITSTDVDEVMPPEHINKPLNGAEAETLRRWIASGAEMKAHWAYVRPAKHPVPDTKGGQWARNWIDAFVLARLEQEGLRAAGRCRSGDTCAATAFRSYGPSADTGSCAEICESAHRRGMGTTG